MEIITNQKKNQVLIFAHRGASKLAPENTLKSFQKAIDLKADYIEFDLHQTKDGEIVIMHDSNTFRTTGHKGKIKQMTLEELKELNCEEGEKIPTLRELVKIAKGKIDFLCEIKVNGIAKKVVEILREADLIESTIISSFKHDELLGVQKIDPNLKIAALEPMGIRWVTSWVSKKKIIQNAIQKNFSFIHIYKMLATKKFIKIAHKHNIKVNAWTVDSPKTMRRLINKGIDGIITNDVETAKEVLKREN